MWREQEQKEENTNHEKHTCVVAVPVSAPGPCLFLLHRTHLPRTQLVVPLSKIKLITVLTLFSASPVSRPDWFLLNIIDWISTVVPKNSLFSCVAEQRFWCDENSAMRDNHMHIDSAHNSYADEAASCLQLDCPSVRHWAYTGIFAVNVWFQMRDQFWIFACFRVLKKVCVFGLQLAMAAFPWGQSCA